MNLDQETRMRLAHVLWLGGAPDAGKTTIAKSIADRHGLSVYHYDRADAEHLQRLAADLPEARRFLEASLEERWILPTPQAMFETLCFLFPHRFRLVVESLLEMPRNPPILVEGFGLLPELVAPLLSEGHQVAWLVPGGEFKWASMSRRGKPSFASKTSDPEKARLNLFARDKLLADHYRRQASALGYRLLEVDGSQSMEELTNVVDAHFAQYRAVLP